MKKRIGGILIVSGAILLLNPNMEFSTWLPVLEKVLAAYWPVLLIILGLMLQSDRKKTKKTHH